MDGPELMLRVLVILAAWCGLSFPLAVLVGRVIAWGNPIEELVESEQPERIDSSQRVPVTAYRRAA